MRELVRYSKELIYFYSFDFQIINEIQMFWQINREIIAINFSGNIITSQYFNEPCI